MEIHQESFDDEIGRRNYINQLNAEKQRSIVNVRRSSHSTSCVWTWTHRSTGCDVISTVTTTVPIKNGNMKDIKMYNSEMRKIKAPGKKPGLNLYVSPLEDGATDSNSRSRRLCSDILKAERNAFMTRLRKSRNQRTTMENISAIIIQRIFRGHWVRCNMQFIMYTSQMHIRIRSLLRSCLENKGLTFKTLSEHRSQYTSKRTLSAKIIQCAFRCYISRALLRRRRFEVRKQIMHRSAIRIQCMVRCRTAVQKVKVKLERNLLFKKYHAALLMQSAYRSLLARRAMRKRLFKLHWLAARMIQCAFRGRKTRKSFMIFLAGVERIKLYRGARAMQRIIRGKVARSRVKRIRLRFMYLKVFRSVTKIQSLVRKFLSICRVSRLRNEVEVKKLAREKDEQAKAALEEEKQAQDLADSIDIFVQARKGNASAVDSLYHHECELRDVKTDTDDIGDTVLSTAARHGHMDIVRKCLQWGYDINHVNATGESVVAAAAQNGHMDVVIYLLNASASLSAKDGGTFLTSSVQLECTEEDIAVILIAAAESKDVKYVRSVLEKEPEKVNAKHPLTDATALHAASFAGNLEIVQFLLKNGAKADILDEMGQTALHKACCSDSLIVVKTLLGLAEEYPTILCSNNQDRCNLLLTKDCDGKDCYLLAALSGRTELLALIATFINATSWTIGDEIGWSPNDVSSVVKLADENSVDCMNVVLDAGFDLSWVPEETGTTAVMAACRKGNTSMIDLLIKKGTDFSVRDVKGRNALHYAAECTASDVVPYVLSAGRKGPDSAKISPSLIAERDEYGQTVLHIAARHGSSLSFELLADQHMDTALQTRDVEGLTPFLVACKYGSAHKIRELLNLGADVTDKDNTGKNALWHYIFASSISSDGFIKTDIEADVIKHLLRSGCKLFSSVCRNIDNSADAFKKYNSEVQHDLANSKPESVAKDLEVADMLAYENKLTILNMLPDQLDSEDCWRLVLSCLYFGKSNKPLASVLDGNGMTSLIRYCPSVQGNSIDALLHVFYQGINIMGWAIRAKNAAVLTYLFRKGADPNAFVDQCSNTSVHFAAASGSLSVVDVVLNAHDEQLMLEKENQDSKTPAMIAASIGDMPVLRKLIRCGCSGRTALNAKYWGWLLAIVRQKEITEVNCQTGIYGDDDNQYFPTSPDPNYVIWE